MSELRYEPIYGRHVIIAPDRLLRPNALAVQTQARHPSDARNCPFCRGNEAMTPEAVLTLPDEPDAPWQVRVVPNRYPAVGPVAVPGVAQGVQGIHEVVIESGAHHDSLLKLSHTERFLVLQAYRQRLQYLRGLPDVGWGFIFKNQGMDGGASQPHVHSQVLGMTEPSPAAARSLRYSWQYWSQHQTCVFCQQAWDESQGGARVVKQTDDFIAFCPAASRFAFETWIMPRAHAGSFELTGDQLLGRLAEFLAETLARLENSIENVAYNFAIHTAPFDNGSHDHYHWHIVIYPRLARLAGCELFADIYINPVDPEFAAEQLRNAAQTT